MSKKDYYKILGVSKDSSIDEIKKAYKKIAKKSHPDIDKKSDYTEFLSLQEAYFVLSDHTRRKQYDKELEEKHIDINQYNGFDDFFVKQKRAYVIFIVSSICKKRRLPMPSINFGGCVDEGGDLAHYHPDTNTICISERQLHMQDMDDLRKTMAHEVSHILHHHHGSRFLQDEILSNISAWDASTGGSRASWFAVKRETLISEEIHTFITNHLNHVFNNIYSVIESSTKNNKSKYTLSLREWHHKFSRKADLFTFDNIEKDIDDLIILFASIAYENYAKRNEIKDILKQILLKIDLVLKVNQGNKKIKQYESLRKDIAAGNISDYWGVNHKYESSLYRKIASQINNITSGIKSTITKKTSSNKDDEEKSNNIKNVPTKKNNESTIDSGNYINITGVEGFFFKDFQSEINYSFKKIGKISRSKENILSELKKEYNSLNNKKLDLDLLSTWLSKLYKKLGDDVIHNKSSRSNCEYVINDLLYHIFTKKLNRADLQAKELDTFQKIVRSAAKEKKPNEKNQNGQGDTEGESTSLTNKINMLIATILFPLIFIFMFLKKSIQFVFKVWYIIPIILIMGVIYYTTTATIVVETNETIPIITTTIENQTVESIISIEDYIADPYKWDGRQEVLQGYLKRYSRRMPNSNAGVFVDVLIDDFNNEIDLIRIAPEYRSLFLEENTNLFEVSGTFKRTYRTLEFIPISFREIERPVAGIEFIEHNVTTYEVLKGNITLPKYPVVRNFVYNLINKDVECSDGTRLGECSVKKPYFCGYNDLIQKPADCGCPEGYRLYNKECIIIVECSDGTLEPECSQEKPKQCVNGILINKASVCGCPEDNRRVGDSCEKILRCTDGTIYGDCSRERPLYCENGRLIEKASECGCLTGFKAVGNICISRVELEAKEAFEYLNEIRKKQGRKELVWDERVYNLGMARVKDMNLHKYLDHVNPYTGECPDNMKTDYGFRFSEYVAENAYGMYGANARPKEAIDSWMTSRGHRYNLLFESHIAGAISCYGGYCVFLGLNNLRFGEGCYTGEEGTAFWQTAGKQPGEI